MRVRIATADTHHEIERCQRLISEIYNGQYGVVFSTDHYDLDAKVEPWPHRYLMFTACDGRVLGTLGLYVRDTYVARFGGIADDDIAQKLDEAGVRDRYDLACKRELTKLVVAPEARGLGLARSFLQGGLSRAFLQVESEREHLLLLCSKRSMWNRLWLRTGMHARVLKPFPRYKVHEQFSSDADPMDSRLVIPALDIPPHLYELALPAEVEVG